MLEPAPRKFPNRKRPRRDPKPRFKAARANQLDFVMGCPEAQVPADHNARSVLRIVELLDLSAVESTYSSLGRRGYSPRSVLATLVYGSLIGLHHSTKLAAALQTDAALRLVSEGHAISAGTLRAFRRQNAALFEAALSQTVKIASEVGLLKADELATDSVRLRANASSAAARTVTRSKKRLEELRSVDTSTLKPEARVAFEAKMQKHEAALAACQKQGRTNLVTTCPSAGLMKFPSGAAAPGHRVTVTAAGVRERLIVDVLIDADAHDFGKLEGAMQRTQKLFEQVGATVDRMQVAADAGYWSDADLTFAADNTGWVDVLSAERATSYRGSTSKAPLFSPANFTLREDGKAICPAGTTMEGPFKDGNAARYHGVGCAACPLRAKCIKGKRKYLTISPAYLEVRKAMQARMQQPGAAKRYNKRIATIEPVFASIQDNMGFRRLSSQKEQGIRAEILLKALAHNISRLAAPYVRLCRVRFWLSW